MAINEENGFAFLSKVAENAEYEKLPEIQSTNSNVVITIAREYGSGGRYIGKLVAEKLGIKLYDKNIIENMAEDTGLDEEYIEENEQKRNVLDVFNNGYYVGLNNADELFIKESEFNNYMKGKKMSSHKEFINTQIESYITNYEKTLIEKELVQNPETMQKLSKKRL